MNFSYIPVSRHEFIYIYISVLAFLDLPLNFMEFVFYPANQHYWHKPVIHVSHLRPDLYYCQTVAGLLMCGPLSDERTGLSFTIPAGLASPVILGSESRRIRGKLLVFYCLLSTVYRTPNSRVQFLVSVVTVFVYALSRRRA
jgi:hypothetical protein